MRTHQGLERGVILEVVVQISVGHHPVHLDAEKKTPGWDRRCSKKTTLQDFSPGLHDQL